MLGSVSSLAGCGGGCGGGCGQFCRCGNAYGAYGAYGRVSRKSDISVWHARCLAATAKQKAGKKLFDGRNVDIQVEEWCSREEEWRQLQRQRAAEGVILEKAGEDVSLDLPSFADINAGAASGPPILPIVAFLAIAGIGGYILYRRGK